MQPQHAPATLPGATVDAYNAEIRDESGFVGDHATNRAFQSILCQWRERLRAAGEDPLGDRATEDISRRRLEQVLLHGDPEAAGLVLSAVEEFAQELVRVCRRLLALDAWADTQRIAVGGGFRASRLGELAIGRAGVLLRAAVGVEMRPIHHDPDQAGLLGAAMLAPGGIAAEQAVLAVDIGGSKIRVGRVGRSDQGDALRVLDTAIWAHAEERPDRGEAVGRLAGMLRAMADKAGDDPARSLAPFVGIGCPGLIRNDGTIARGGQNLPGDWEAPGFNLPQQLTQHLPPIQGRTPLVLLHNDAVAQGLSEAAWMQDVRRWGIFTIGTGLGNARFTNRG
ncbi:MAG TPA: hypothetical protein VFN42_13310 [Acetobacteraceae bacterium]|nr:hypothetical protein [Acetobacteraceae bacterium]